MNTLVVYFSKTGNTKKVAEDVIKELGCDHAVLTYDEKADKTEGFKDPSGYERVILLCPIWAFRLPAPMKQYLKEYGASIKSYSLIVTYSLFGLRGCVRNCVTSIGSQPHKAFKLKGKKVIAGEYDVRLML